MAKKGNPTTFRDGSMELTPLTDGTPGTGIHLIIKDGSISDEVDEVEAPGNCIGVMIAPGPPKVTITGTAYVSSAKNANVTGSNITMKTGDYCNLEVINGMLDYEGEFMASKFDVSLDPTDATTIEFTFRSNGDVRKRQIGIVTCVANGTLSAGSNP